MKYIFSLLLVFICSASFGATSQVNSIVQPATGINNNATTSANQTPITLPFSTTNLDAIVRLIAPADAQTANNYVNFGNQSNPSTSLAAYQVPAGKKLYLYMMYCTANAATNPGITFGYGTAALGTISGQAGAPTGSVEYGQSTGGAGGYYINITGTGSIYQLPIWLVFPANSYPYQRMNTAQSVQRCWYDGIVQ